MKGNNLIIIVLFIIVIIVGLLANKMVDQKERIMQLEQMYEQERLESWLYFQKLQGVIELNGGN